MVYILGLFAIIIGGGFIVAILDICHEAHEDWQKK